MKKVPRDVGISKISVITMEKKPALCNSHSLLLTQCFSTSTTVEKGEIKDFPKLPSAFDVGTADISRTSFICKTLFEMADTKEVNNVVC